MVRKAKMSTLKGMSIKELNKRITSLKKEERKALKDFKKTKKPSKANKDADGRFTLAHNQIYTTQRIIVAKGGKVKGKRYGIIGGCDHYV